MMDSLATTSRKRQRDLGSENNASSTPARKRARGRQFSDRESTLEQARPYHILTARMPVDALTAKWTLGQNRPIDSQHAQKLCSIFMQGGLNRNAKEHHLRVTCSRGDVSNMMMHLGLGHAGTAPPPNDIPVFSKWLSVNNGRKVEILAGQHRIKALEAYVERTGSSSNELWWPCEFYDQDTLPPDLNLGLRVNRKDPALADSHGEIWVQVMAASSQNPKLFQGKGADIEQQMKRALHLSGEVKFPLRRLVTVWRNERWRAMVTRWCQTTIGRTTFQISTWDWMISYRMDDFWFTTFQNVLTTLTELPGDAAKSVELTDWALMSASLLAGRTELQVQELFYPNQTQQQIEQSPERRPNFLIAFDDSGYRAVYECILQSPRLQFPNIHRLIRLSKDEGRVLYLVMSHVVAWLNPNPTVIIDRRDNNKPPLRNDLLPALQHVNSRLVRKANRRLQTSIQDIQDQPSPEAASIALQQEILEFTLAHLAAFKSPATKAYLEQLPIKVDGERYADRFLDKAWGGVLGIVRWYVGPEFQPKWMTSNAAATATATADSSKPLQTAADFVEAFCQYMKTAPAFARNAALNHKLNSAIFRDALASWFSEQFRLELEEGGINRHIPPNLALEATTAETTRGDKEDVTYSSPSISPDAQKVQAPILAPVVSETERNHERISRRLRHPLPAIRVVQPVVGGAEEPGQTIAPSSQSTSQALSLSHILNTQSKNTTSSKGAWRRGYKAA